MLQFDSDLSGILLLDKPVGLTSHDVVHRIRRATGMKRVGHAGTLDPLAMGLLIVLIGRATKISQFLINLDKSYEGTMQLGIETDSHDSEGNIVAQRGMDGVTLECLRAAAVAFEGDLEQVPPMFSAKKLNGKPLYRLARQGKVVDRKSNPVKIFKFEIKSLHANRADFCICCSKGTYVRTLAHDLGQKLGCGAHLSALRRTKIGNFSLGEAHSLEKICTMPRHEICECLITSYLATRMQ
ncbi:MAG: tRNA pseudouridine(55) synthase TruB [Puniceicoccales bacterium]|jgi:tRNA pseudouridine55 synthase|nr:tRNA pseudouridine(55) synthase TruB [Puniceicoccales bacterium]